MDKKNLITIGTLAKLTGVNIKSLYYYEQIELLIPVFTDPSNGYRYYSHEQILLIGWIQHGVDLGVPLKELREYISADGHTIYSDALLEYEIELTERKIEMLKNKLQLLSAMKQEIAFSETILKYDNPVICDFGQKILYVARLTPPFSLVSVQKEIMKLFFSLRELNLTQGNEMGIVCFERDSEKETYAFLDVLASQCIPQSPDFIFLPPGTYQCIKTTATAINSADQLFPELYARKYDKILIETTVLTHTNDTNHNTFHLRCSMPDS